MSDKINMSLEDIIKKNKISVRGNKKGFRGRSFSKSPRGAGGNRGTFQARRGKTTFRSEKPSLVSPRRGAVSTSSGPCSLIVSNLDFGVSDSDVQELFSEFGQLKKAAIHYDRSGRSLGTAEVIFIRKSDAIKAMKQYNGVPLDGRAMSIQMVTSEAQPTPEPRSRNFSPNRSPGRVYKRGGGAAGRGGRRGGGRGGGATKKTVPTADELDKELDSYLKAR